MARGLAVVDVYLTLRDALQAEGILNPYQEFGEFKYYYTAEDGSVFVVQVPGTLRALFADPYIEYVAGPRKGTTETITWEQVEEYRELGEAKYGKLIPGGWFGESRFIPGQIRKTLPVFDTQGFVIGYVDESGVHYFPHGQKYI